MGKWDLGRLDWAQTQKWECDGIWVTKKIIYRLGKGIKLNCWLGNGIYTPYLLYVLCLFIIFAV